MIRIARPYRMVHSGGFSSVNSIREAKSRRRQWLYIIAGVLFFRSFFCTSKRKNIKHSIAFLEKQKEKIIVEMLTVQLVIYVNIDDDIKKHFTHVKKTFNSIKKTFC